MKLKRLFLDIETSFNIVASWRIGYKINLSPENILKERAIVCVCYKWEGDRKVHSIEWDRNMDDRAMLQALLPILNSADEIVMQNGDRFDLPWIKTRCIFHRLPTYPDYKTIDTLQWAKRNFLFNSNRLDYIAQFLGGKGKLHTKFDWWKEIVWKNNRTMLAKMVAYCKRDVVELESVYHKLAAHVAPKSHVGVMHGLKNWSCPHCGSEDVAGNGSRWTAMGVKQHRFQCRSCHRNYRVNGNVDPAKIPDKKSGT